jgi:hypothetical protein
MVAGGVMVASPASAASYAKGVYEPIDKGDHIEGWADVNTDCEGTFGCYTYVKMEFRSDNPARPPWLNAGAWEFAGGNWAQPGWNKVTTKYRGCGDYRMVVDSYNDATGDAVLGISLGPVELNLGGGVQRYHKSSASRIVRVCQLA